MKVTKVEATKSIAGRTVTVTFDDGQMKSWTFGLVQKADKTWALPPVQDVAREVKALVKETEDGGPVSGLRSVPDTALGAALAELTA